MSRVFLTAEWRHLAMLNYAVDADLLRPLVPRGTELDFFGGRAYVSLVAFRFLNTRVLGLPIPGHRDFDEANLRFYVRRASRNQIRRGVVFIREIVPRHAIAAVARWAYNENYVTLPMWHDISPSRVTYGWENRACRCEVDLQASETGAHAAEGSEQQFICEHYWGYSAQRDGSSMEYEVTHEPWMVRDAVSARFEGEASSLYGPDFARVLQRRPDSAFLAEGSSIQVGHGRRIPWRN